MKYHPYYNPLNFPRGLGYHRSSPDPRNLIFRSTLSPEAAPSAVSWSSYVTDQWSQRGGSCVGHGWTGAFEVLRNKTPNTERIKLSPMEVYAECRIRDGTFPADVGTYVSSGAWVLNHLGVASDAAFPGTASGAEPGYDVRPDATVLADALQRTLSQYLTIPTLSGSTQVKLALAQGDPVVGGFGIYHSASGTAWGDQIVPMPPVDANDTYWGGHCWYICGYNDGPGVQFGIPAQCFECFNSWGLNSQRFYIHYAFVDQFSWELYVPQIEINPPPGTKAMTTTNLASAVASVAGGNNPTGTITVTASYSGDANNAPSTSSPLVIPVGGSPPPPPPPSGTSITATAQAGQRVNVAWSGGASPGPNTIAAYDVGGTARKGYIFAWGASGTMAYQAYNYSLNVAPGMVFEYRLIDPNNNLLATSVAVTLI